MDTANRVQNPEGERWMCKQRSGPKVGEIKARYSVYVSGRDANMAPGIEA